MLQIHSKLISRAFNRAFTPTNRLYPPPVQVFSGVVVVRHPPLQPAPHWLSTYEQHSSSSNIVLLCCPRRLITRFNLFIIIIIIINIHYYSFNFPFVLMVTVAYHFKLGPTLPHRSLDIFWVLFFFELPVNAHHNIETSNHRTERKREITLNCFYFVKKRNKIFDWIYNRLRRAKKRGIKITVCCALLVFLVVLLCFLMCCNCFCPTVSTIAYYHIPAAVTSQTVVFVDT